MEILSNPETLQAGLGLQGVDSELARQIVWMLVNRSETRNPDLMANLLHIEEMYNAHIHAGAGVHCIRERQSTQSFVTATTTIVKYDVEDYLCGDCSYDAATGKITLNEDGIWHVTGSLHLDDPTGGYQQLELIHTNSLGTTYVVTSQTIESLATNRPQCLHVSSDLFIEDGDKVWLSYYQTSGVNQPAVNNGPQTFLCLHYVAPCTGTPYSAPG